VVVLSTLLPEGPLASFDAQHAFFTQKMLQRFQYCGAIWVYLQSTTLWTLWVAHNDTVFYQEQWPCAKLESMIWTSLTDYSWAAWLRLQKRKFKNEAGHLEAIGNYMSIWTVNEYLCKCDGDRIL
jgi:hypothetical protein